MEVFPLEQSGGELEGTDSALYHALYRLEARGLVEAQWGVTKNRRQARYYGITPEGHAPLASEAAAFERYASTVVGILAAGTQARGGGS